MASIAAEEEREAPKRSKWITRNEAASLLGCTYRMVLKHEAAYRIRSVELDGVRLCAGDDVRRLLRDNPAKAATVATDYRPRAPSPAQNMRGAVFRMFEDQATLAEIVAATHISTERIRALWDEWDAPLGSSTRRLEAEIEAKSARELEAFERQAAERGRRATRRGPTR